MLQVPACCAAVQGFSWHRHMSVRIAQATVPRTVNLVAQLVLLGDNSCQAEQAQARLSGC
jgi:hypothetical protein